MRASAATQPGARGDRSLRVAVVRAGSGQRPAGGGRACELGDGTCPSCLRRGVYALGAIERGRELADIASSMRLPVARVRELVRLARDRRELRSYDKRPLLVDAQWFITVELARTQGLT